MRNPVFLRREGANHRQQRQGRRIRAQDARTERRACAPRCCASSASSCVKPPSGPTTTSTRPRPESLVEPRTQRAPASRAPRRRAPRRTRSNRSRSDANATARGPREPLGARTAAPRCARAAPARELLLAGRRGRRCARSRTAGTRSTPSSVPFSIDEVHPAALSDCLRDVEPQAADVARVLAHFARRGCARTTGPIAAIAA